MDICDPARPSRLTLGTAQLGLVYGLANRDGLPDDHGVKTMLDMAWSHDIRTLDTAMAYGDAEARIGTWIAGRIAGRMAGRMIAPAVVTKLKAGLAPDQVVAAATASRRRLRLEAEPYGYAVMAHRAGDLRDLAFAHAFCGLRGSAASAVGASCYDSDEVAQVLALPDLGLLQIPVSAFNMHLLEDGRIADAVANRGLTVYARSVFVQGVLTMAPEDLPNHLAVLAAPLARFRGLAAEAGLSPAALALGTVAARPEIASIVIGADNPEQIAANAAAMRAPLDQDLVRAAARLGRDLPRAAYDPSFWPAP